MNPRRIRLLMGFLALGTLFAVAAVACGDEPEAADPTAMPTQAAGQTPDAATATATTPVDVVGEAPDPDSPANTAVLVAPNRVGITFTGMNSTGAPDGPWGIAEGFFQPSGVVGEDIVSPVLAETWEVADDLSKVTIGIKSGVQFHGDWGELTADDVVWSFNDLIAPESVHNQSGDYAAVFEPMVKVDDYTVDLPFKAFTVVWNQALLNTFAGTNGTFSKNAFDEMGRDWMNENVVATGPYQLMEFRPQEILRLESFADHHTQPAGMQFMNVHDVPEEATRLAMLENGQADIGDISIKRIRELLELGFKTSDSGKASQLAMNFGGNYWEQYDYNCAQGQSSVSCPDITVGEPQEVEVSRPGYQPDEQHPWIGEFGNDESMERARMVRTALSMAIDREAINDVILDGLGWANYVQGFSTKAPQWEEQWEIPYDPDEAARLLDEAGYPMEGGRRFDVSMFVTNHVGGPGGAAGEIQSAVGAMWDEIGVSTSLLRHDYAVWRQTVVDRTEDQPFLSACGGTDARDSVPWDFPKGVVFTTLSRGGFSCGMELPFVLDNYIKTSTEQDIAKRIEYNTELLEYYHHWRLVPGVVVGPEPLVWNPKTIESWEMRANAAGTHIVSLDTIVPAK
ncbi:MAG: ABC transporter substrate-binding protein [Dehalococcoidia bacterium]